jgi:small basic protein
MNSDEFAADRSLSSPHWLLACCIAIMAGYLVDDWIAGAAVLAIWLVWAYILDDHGLPILAIALTFQWTQVTCGIWYHALSGRPVRTMELSDYRPMVLIGLGCVVALALGLHAGMSLVRRTRHGHSRATLDSIPIGWVGLIVAYAAAFALQGTVSQLAYQFPDFTQAILTFRFVHLALLFLILRRLSRPKPQWHWIGLVMTIEIALGITGFFAGYREPIIMAIIALFEVFNPRRVQQWIGLAAIVLVLATLSLLWIGVRAEYRKEFDNESFVNSQSARFDRMSELSNAWFSDKHDVSVDLDMLIDRMWVVYYPALAVERVPSVLPHTDGSIMWGALQHILSPRVFFPTKAELANDSDMVRKYSGLYVAGTDQNTSIAFGYAGESYIDFGVPWMFLPVLLYGMLAGVAYQLLSVRIHHEELRSGLLAVIFWLTLYLFERSWVKTLGLFGTLLIYLGGPALLLDYYLSRTIIIPDDAEVPPEAEQWT